MRCEVLLFAHLAEAVGSRRIPIELASGSTVGDALEALARDHPLIATMRPGIAVAVNERYEPLDATLPPGCTIALIPPVSGG